jgi:hypothetical protein
MSLLELRKIGALSDATVGLVRTSAHALLFPTGHFVKSLARKRCHSYGCSTLHCLSEANIQDILGQCQPHLQQLRPPGALHAFRLCGESLQHRHDFLDL